MAKQKSSKSKKNFPEFARVATVMGVAGKRISSYEWGGFSLERVHACYALAASWTEKRKVPGSPLVAPPAGDLLNGAADPWEGAIAIGFRVYRAAADDGHAWAGLSLDGMRERIERAREIEDAVWRSFAEALCPERADEIVAALSEQPVELMLVATGPLASGVLAQGVLSYEPQPGFHFVRGQDMEQERHSFGIAGVVVATAESTDMGVIDLSPEAHAARLAEVQQLDGITVVGPNGPEKVELGYAILASYDAF